MGHLLFWNVRFFFSFISSSNTLALVVSNHFFPLLNMCWAMLSCSVRSKSLRLHGLQPASFLCPWDFPGKTTGVGCHSLLHRVFPTQGSNPGLLHCRQILYQLSSQGTLNFFYILQFKPEFCNEFMIWATVSSKFCFCWLYRASPFLAAKNKINLIFILTIWWCPRVELSLMLLEEGVCYDKCVLLTKLC